MYPPPPRLARARKLPELLAPFAAPLALLPLALPPPLLPPAPSPPPLALSSAPLHTTEMGIFAAIMGGGGGESCIT